MHHCALAPFMSTWTNSLPLPSLMTRSVASSNIRIASYSIGYPAALACLAQAPDVPVPLSLPAVTISKYRKRVDMQLVCPIFTMKLRCGSIIPKLPHPSNKKWVSRVYELGVPLVFEEEIPALKLIMDKERRVLSTKRTVKDVEMAFEKEQKFHVSYQGGTKQLQHA